VQDLDLQIRDSGLTELEIAAISKSWPVIGEKKKK